MLSLKRTIMISIITLSIGVAALITYYAYGILYQQKLINKNNFIYYSENSANRLAETLERSIDAAKLIAYSYSNQRFLLSDEPSLVIDSMQSLNDLYSFSSLYINGHADIELRSYKGRHYSGYNNYTNQVNQALAMEGLTNSYELASEHFSAVIDGKYLLYLFPVKGVIDGYRFNHNCMIGAVIFNMNTLLQEGALPDEYTGIICIRNTDTVIGASTKLSSEMNQTVLMAEEGIRSTNVDKTSFYIHVIPLADTSLHAVYLIPAASPVKMPLGKRAPIILIILLILLILFIILYTLNRLQKSINTMEQDIMLAEKDLKPIRTPNISELETISKVINKTFSALDKSYSRETHLIQDNYEALLAQIQAEMLAYRNQINPHFLFNTLESARSMAHHYNAEPVCELIEGMSKMFRYALYASTEVPFSDELDNLNAYLSVMNIRFPGRYHLRTEIADETRSCTVIPVLLQPIIENTIKHAFNGRSTGTIYIGSWLEGHILHIRIADNGSGINTETLQNIRRDFTEFRNRYVEETTYGRQLLTTQSSNDESVGLINIFRRLILYFGDKANLMIDTRPGRYTKIDIYIPKKE